jgi:hypothetical protein
MTQSLYAHVNKGNKKKKKILKQVETEQHIAERPVGD